MGTPNPVPKLYRSIVEDVINNVRESFLDENVDEQILQELKQLWESKMLQSKAVDSVSREPERLSVYSGLHSRHQVALAALPTLAMGQQLTTQIPVPIQAQLPIFNTQNATLAMSAAAQTATMALPAGLYSQQLAALQRGTITLQPGQIAPQFILQAGPMLPGALQAGGVAPVDGSATYTIPGAAVAPDQPVSRITAAAPSVIQLDGANDSSSDDDDDDDDKDEDEEKDDTEGEEEEPLNSADDISDEDPTELFDSENVVVCQFDKINRSKNKWKFYLKDGIMNLNGKDYVFQKGNGDAEW